MNLKKIDLKRCPPGAFLLCPVCGTQWSADYNDYFWLPDDKELVCSLSSCFHEPLVFARDTVKVVPPLTESV